MSDFTHRELSKDQRLVKEYEALVASLTNGYGMSIYEYTNDMSCRQRLEEARSEIETRELWQRVEIADSRLRKILRPTKNCIHGSRPPECFWYWGYPPNSPELEADLRTIGALGSLPAKALRPTTRSCATPHRVTPPGKTAKLDSSAGHFRPAANLPGGCPCDRSFTRACSTVPSATRPATCAWPIAARRCCSTAATCGSWCRAMR